MNDQKEDSSPPRPLKRQRYALEAIDEDDVEISCRDFTLNNIQQPVEVPEEVVVGIVLSNGGKQAGEISQRAYDALTIVLQYWMVPDLGWYIHKLGSRQDELKEDLLERIIEYKEPKTSSKSYKGKRNLSAEQKHEYSEMIEVPIGDDDMVNDMLDRLTELDLSALLPEHQISFHGQEGLMIDNPSQRACALTDIKSTIQMIFQSYFLFFIHKAEYQWNNQLKRLHSVMISLYQEISQLFSRQREKWPNHKTIIYQLVNYTNWKAKVEVAEIAQMKYAILPSLLQTHEKTFDVNKFLPKEQYLSIISPTESTYDYFPMDIAIEYLREEVISPFHNIICDIINCCDADLVGMFTNQIDSLTILLQGLSSTYYSIKLSDEIQECLHNIQANLDCQDFKSNINSQLSVLGSLGVQPIYFLKHAINNLFGINSLEFCIDRAWEKWQWKHGLFNDYSIVVSPFDRQSPFNFIHCLAKLFRLRVSLRDTLKEEAIQYALEGLAVMNSLLNNKNIHSEVYLLRKELIETYVAFAGIACRYFNRMTILSEDQEYQVERKIEMYKACYDIARDAVIEKKKVIEGIIKNFVRTYWNPNTNAIQNSSSSTNNHYVMMPPLTAYYLGNEQIAYLPAVRNECAKLMLRVVQEEVSHPSALGDYFASERFSIGAKGVEYMESADDLATAYDKSIRWHRQKKDIEKLLILQLAGQFHVKFASLINLGYTIKYFEDDDVDEEIMEYSDMSEYEGRERDAWINGFIFHDLHPVLLLVIERYESSTVFGTKANDIVYEDEDQNDDDEEEDIFKDCIPDDLISESALLFEMYLMFHGASCPDHGETLPNKLRFSLVPEFAKDFPSNHDLLMTLFDFHGALSSWDYHFSRVKALQYSGRPSLSHWNLLFCCLFWIRKYFEAAKMQYDEIHSVDKKDWNTIRSYFTHLSNVLNESMVELMDAIDYLTSSFQAEVVSLSATDNSNTTSKDKFFLNQVVLIDKISPQILVKIESLKSDMKMVDNLFRETAKHCAERRKLCFEASLNNYVCFDGLKSSELITSSRMLFTR